MKPLILLTNDDGIQSPGLRAAVEAVLDLGEILISAPLYQQTSMGRSFPKAMGIGKIKKVRYRMEGEELAAYGVAGSPAQAVAHGVLELAERKPDLCISGINYGENLGLCLTCSGTIGAIFEADSYDIPSIAISRQADLAVQHSLAYQQLDWETAKRITRQMTIQMLQQLPQPAVSMLNINVPESADEQTPYRYTKLARYNSSVFTKPGSRKFQQPYRLQSEINLDYHKTDQDTDIFCFYIKKCISITPLSWDFTDHKWFTNRSK